MPQNGKNKKKFTFTNNEGVRYTVLFHKPNARHFGEADGTCADPDEKSPKIHINPYLTKQSELNTCIHEFTHAFFWEATEKEVYKFANALSRFLYNHCKWRKLEKRKLKKGSVYRRNLLEKAKKCTQKKK